MCDPPRGWRYGFPKPMPLELKDNYNGFLKWLVKEGYPENEIKSEYFFCSYFQAEIDQPVVENLGENID